MFSLEELFCPIDDFCLSFEPNWKKQLIQSRFYGDKGYISNCHFSKKPSIAIDRLALSA
jgi:hypothetical protein